MEEADLKHRPKVLLISFFDPTSPLVGALRVDRTAHYLDQFGWQVKVISSAGVTHYESGVRAAPPASTTQHFAVPTADSSWFLRGKRVAGRIFDRYLAFPDPGVLAVRRMLRHSVDLGDWRPDVIVVSGPPFSQFLIARHLSRAWSVPWVADYRDLWTNSTYYVPVALRRLIDRRVERWIVRTAAMTVTVSEPLAEDLRRDFGVRCEVVMNGFEPEECDTHRESVLPTPGLPLRIVYTGEMYARKRDPRPLFEAMRRLGLGPDEIQVVFRGITVLPIAGIAQELGVSAMVEVGPALPRAECLALQKGSDAQLLMMWNDPREAGNVTGKLFEYLGSRRPILMLGYEKSVAATMLREREAGFVANTPDEIAAVLLAWIHDKRQGGSVPATSETVTDGLTRREQTARLSRLLSTVVGDASHVGVDN